MRIAFLYTKSELTPWQENVDESTLKFLVENTPDIYETSIIHFDGFNDDMLQKLGEVDLVYNLSYGYKDASQVDVAAWLDFNNIPHTASSILSMTKAQDKSLLPDICSKLSLNTPALFYNSDLLADELLYISKPRKGSCHRNIHIENGLWMKSNLDIQRDDLIVQPYIFGREFSVAVIPSFYSNSFIALPPCEIIPLNESEIFVAGQSYGVTTKVFKPEISIELKHHLMSAALKLHKSMGLVNTSRTDFRVDNEQNIYALDVNAMPNMHPEKSLLPALLRYHNISISQLIETIIKSSLVNQNYFNDSYVGVM